MVRRLKRILGRVEVRILLLLSFGALACTLALTLAQTLRYSPPVSTLPQVSSWNDLVSQYLDFREHNWPLILPTPEMQSGQLQALIQASGLGAFQKEPGWYWNIDGGTFCFDPKSSLAKLVKSGSEIVIYEDMQNQELLVMAVPDTKDQPYREEVVYRAPTWPAPGKNENYETYLYRELSKRRIAWQVTLKSTADAIASSMSVQTMTFSQNGGMQMMGMEEYTNQLWISLRGPAQGVNSGVEVTANLPDGFTNRIEFFTCTNLIDFWWTLAATNLSTAGTNAVCWTDSPPTDVQVRFYAFGNADVDSDTDGLTDAREKFLYHTDPNNPDTDGDGLSDGWEVQNGFDPNSSAGDNGAAGDPDGDGLSNLEEQKLGTDPRATNQLRHLNAANVVLECRSEETTRSKCGFLEYANPSTPPRYYLSERGLYRVYHNSDLDGEECLGEDANDWASYDALTGAYGGSNVTVWTLVEWDTNDYPIGCYYETYTNSAYGYTYRPCDYSCSNWPTCEIGQTTIHKFYHADEGPYGCFTCGGWDQGGTAYWEEQCDRNLSDEYTTPMLLANAAADLSRCGVLSDLAWGEGRNWVTTGCETGSTASAAFRNLSSNETSVALRRIQYRYRFVGTPGVIYRLSWFQSFQPDQGPTSIVASGTTVVMGNGTTQYVNDSAFTVDPPSSNGSVVASVFTAQFERSGDCSGFDDTLSPPWIMVPKNDANTAILAIDPSSVAAQIELVSADSSAATVSPSAVNSPPQTITVSGLARGSTRILAEIPGLDSACATLMASVKERVNKTIAIHAIAEENDDVQVIPVGQGQPNQTCITAGSNGVLNTTASGDDTVLGATITTGPDGICNTTAAADDVQVVALGKGKAHAICVGKGANNFRDTNPSGDDTVVGDDIDSGTDGICNTTAKATNLVPSNVPNAAMLQSYLNDLFGKQANVYVTVTRSDYSVNYDLDRNGGVPDPPNTGEMDAISAAAKDNSADVNMYFVNVMDAPIATTIITRHEGWIQDSHVGTTEFVAAHEICHALGRSGHSTDINDLMYPQDTGASPCNLKKNDWDMINP